MCPANPKLIMFRQKELLKNISHHCDDLCDSSNNLQMISINNDQFSLSTPLLLFADRRPLVRRQTVSWPLVVVTDQEPCMKPIHHFIFSFIINFLLFYCLHQQRHIFRNGTQITVMFVFAKGKQKNLIHIYFSSYSHIGIQVSKITNISKATKTC